MIGDILRKKREELGLDLKEVAHSLRIQYEYLKALENNSLEKLPPAVYTRGYIREYARFLDVDPEPLVAEYAEGQSKDEERIKPALTPAPVKKKFSLRFAVILITLVSALMLAVIIYFPFYIPKSPPEPPVRKSEHGQAAPLAAPQPSPATEHSQTAQLAGAPKPLPPAEPGMSAPLPVSPKKRYILDAYAIEGTWLRIEMEDGKSEEVLMRPSDTRKWTSQSGFDIKLGNAGGVRLVLNGEDLGTPGEKGQVLRLRLPQDKPPQHSPGDGRIDNIRPGM